MSGVAFDANILIDALGGNEEAKIAIREASISEAGAWISRMVWIEVLSKGSYEAVKGARTFLSGFGLDELDEDVALRAAALRREQPRLKLPDAVILATAQIRGRTLVTRNTKDFRADMPGIRVPYVLD